MPLDINPAWEYWEPDPEIEEVMNRWGRVDEYAKLGIEQRRAAKASAEIGFRFGVGNPNHCRFKLALPKRERESKEPELRLCPGCRQYFIPKKKDRTFCSRSCSKRTEGVQGECAHCHKRFRVLWKGHRFCGRECSFRFGQSASRAKTTKVDDTLFRVMYERGDPIKVIAAAFDVTEGHCKKVRRRLGIPPRGPKGKAGI